MLTTKLITSDDELAALEAPWNALAGGQPMRTWNWLATWWKHFGASADDSGRAGRRELRVIAIFDSSAQPPNELIGIAPWYLDRTAVKGDVLRPLGNGEVCTDHLSLLCESRNASSVVGAVAEYLSARDDQWERLELSGVDADDPIVDLLTEELTAHECLVFSRPAGNCWIIDLPKTWDEYVAELSRSHRRQLRQCHDRMVKSGRARWHLVTNHAELEQAWKVLIDLHQRRRTDLGDAGCFASKAFHDYHRDVVALLLASGQLRMSWLELDGSPFTAEYHFSGPQTVYTYQSGMDPDRLDESPGRLAYMLTVQRAIEDGYRHLDFLRGDESYKSHFRATPRPINDLRVFPNRRLARLRGHLTNAALSLRDWMKQGVESVTN